MDALSKHHVYLARNSNVNVIDTTDIFVFSRLLLVLGLIA